MPRWLTLPAVSAAALLAFAAYSAPQSALELNYQAPDPSMFPRPSRLPLRAGTQNGKTADCLDRGER